MIQSGAYELAKRMRRPSMFILTGVPSTDFKLSLNASLADTYISERSISRLGQQAGDLSVYSVESVALPHRMANLATLNKVLERR